MNPLKTIHRLLKDESGLALTEFAFATPVMLTLGLVGLEMSNLAITHMKISQAAMRIADDASRIGEVSSLKERKIYEYQINDLLLGSDIQAGGSLDIFEHGRVIVSSQEVDPDDPDEEQQYIHWQRCMGKRMFDSDFGPAGTGKGDPGFKGMGPKDLEVMALPDSAVMFVEISYEYQPIITDAFVGDREIKVFSSFTVRNPRDLSQIYQKNPLNPVEAATCDKYGRFRDSAADKAGEGGWDWEF